MIVQTLDFDDAVVLRLALVEHGCKPDAWLNEYDRSKVNFRGCFRAESPDHDCPMWQQDLWQMIKDGTPAAWVIAWITKGASV